MGFFGMGLFIFYLFGRDLGLIRSVGFFGFSVISFGNI